MLKNNARIIELPKFLDKRGNLSYIENNSQIPFQISRVYWIYDVPGGEKRGGHAYHDLQEIVIAISGSFNVILNDGEKEYIFHLNRSYFGLYVPKLFWRSMENFSTNSVALILTDKEYNSEQYIRSFDYFKIISKQ